MGRIRYIEEEKSTLLSAQYRKLEELETRKSQEIDSLRRQHREEIHRLKEDHQHAIDVYVVIVLPIARGIRCLENYNSFLDELTINRKHIAVLIYASRE